jgi:drug/metabolite transporter (DMT)-like permease
MVSSAFYEKIHGLRHQHGNFVEAGVWALLWLVASPIAMESIKTLTSSPLLEFPYPWMLVGFTNMGIWIFCSLWRFVPRFVPEVENEVVISWSHSLALGFLQGLEVGIGADILHRISVTLRTEIHMLCPALMFIFGVVSGVEPLDPRLVLAIGAVTVGGLLASYGTMTWEGLNLVPLALLASLFSTVRWVLTQKWLSPSGQRKPSPVVFALRMSPMTALVGFLVAVVREPAAYAGLLHLPFPGEVTSLLLVISFCVSLMLVAEMRVVQLTSALLLAFLVPFHNISVILLDTFLKGSKVSVLNWIGIVLCALATGCYSAARQDKKEHASLHLTGPSYQSAEVSA